MDGGGSARTDYGGYPEGSFSEPADAQAADRLLEDLEAVERTWALVAEVEGLSGAHLSARAEEVEVQLGTDPLDSRFGAPKPGRPYTQGLMHGGATLKLHVEMSKRGTVWVSGKEGARET